MTKKEIRRDVNMKYIIDSTILDLGIGEKEMQIIGAIFEILKNENLPIIQCHKLLDACKHMTLYSIIN